MSSTASVNIPSQSDRLLINGVLTRRRPLPSSTRDAFSTAVIAGCLWSRHQIKIICKHNCLHNKVYKSVEIAKKAGRTAYDERYSCRTEPPIKRCNVNAEVTLSLHRMCRAPAASTYRIVVGLFVTCVLWLNDTSYSKSAQRS